MACLDLLWSNYSTPVLRRTAHNNRVLCPDHIDADTRKKGIINKEKMKEILGHSPDYLDMLIMAMLFRIKPIPKRPKAKLGQI